MERNLTDLERTIAFVREQRARPAVILVPEPGELDAVPQRVVEAQRRLAQRLTALGVSYRWLLEDFRVVSAQGAAPLFRDGVHPNPAGNAVMARAAARLIRDPQGHSAIQDR